MISVASLTRRGQDGESTYVVPAVIGAILPDLPMYLFYAVEKLVVGSTEREIWTTRYYLPAWQDFFDLFNSVPLIALGLVVSIRLRRQGWTVLFLSMLLHAVCDLPLHHDDGHRHFWPLSDWRFESPVSYWDPHHFGRQMAVAELALLLCCYIWSMIKHRTIGIRIGLTTIMIVYVGLIAMAIAYWSGQ